MAGPARWILPCAFLAAVACVPHGLVGGQQAITNRDGGVYIAEDGAVLPIDSGVPPDHDGGPPRDAGPRADGGPPRDAGPWTPPTGGAEGSLGAFPGAQGFGTETVGGRGGQVLHVTTLNWDGPGSFSEALYTPGARIIVFEVSGVIDVPDVGREMGPEHSFLTIAGQTSPGGITFRGNGVGGPTLFFYAPQAPDDRKLHDVIVRFVRFRGHGNTDNVTIAGAHHLVFDHCDFSGADDEALDITYAHDVTISWSTVANSGPGSHYGFLFAYAPSTRFSYHHNLSANHANRCGANIHWDEGGPPAEGVDLDIRNNVLHNCGNESFFHLWTGDWSPGTVRANFVGNTMSEGPNTHNGSVAMFGLDRPVAVFADDNSYPGYPLHPDWGNPELVGAAHPMAPVDTAPHAEAYERVLARAGAWPRDAMNVRTVGQVRSGEGGYGLVNDPVIESGPAPPADVDRDGMPDAWEEMNGLVVGTDDSAGDLDDDGWTNIEEYLEARAQSLIGVTP
ncbi:MAG: hypothetical protein RIT81_27340 [Deltaproteobacteria bacterium]